MSLLGHLPNRSSGNTFSSPFPTPWAISTGRIKTQEFGSSGNNERKPRCRGGKRSRASASERFARTPSPGKANTHRRFLTRLDKLWWDLASCQALKRLTCLLVSRAFLLVHTAPSGYSLPSGLAAHRLSFFFIQRSGSVPTIFLNCSPILFRSCLNSASRAANLIVSGARLKRPSSFLWSSTFGN